MLSVSMFRKMTGVSITRNHTGKMANLWSLSTAPTVNPLCAARSTVSTMVCAHCFSKSMQSRFPALRAMLERNTAVLTGRVLSPEELPILSPPSGLFRFEAFGDLINETQVINYFAIARANPTIKCALWTKNPWIIAHAIKSGAVKPDNLVIIGSSYYLNQEMAFRAYPFIDKVFTVYDSEHANTVKINCGARDCAACGRCYTRRAARVVNEKLK